MDHLTALQRYRPVGQGKSKVEIVIDDDDREILSQPMKCLEQLFILAAPYLSKIFNL